VLLAVANKTGEVELMMLNLPSGLYNTAIDADIDVEGYANFTIPRAFNLDSSTGLLIAAFVCKHTATAMEIQSTVDLRGQTPNTASGHGTGGGNVEALAVMADNAVLRGDGGAKDIQDSGVLIDDTDNLSGIANLSLSGTVDGRDVATDGTKLDGIEDGAQADQNLWEEILTDGGSVFPLTTTSGLGFVGGALINTSLTASQVVIAVDEASIDHTAISNIGSNSHAAIDTHIADTSDPHGSSMSVSVQIQCPEIATATGAMSLDVFNNAAHTTLTLQNSDATFEASLDVEKDIIVGGLVDGRNIDTDGTKLDTIATSANNYTHPNHSGDVTSVADGATTLITKLRRHTGFIHVHVPTSADYFEKHFIGSDAITITKVWGITDAGTVTFQLNKNPWTTILSGGTSMLSSAMVADSTGESTTSFSGSDNEIAAESWLAIDASAESGAAHLLVSYEYTVD
jgi:hypothetical protein